ncbi:MAG: hypothetical protein QOC76_1768 [Mycobacterium sp.]|jgi:hypothetical protein|nr:hypothetical protein [Mycobacterium sp.]
MSTNRFNAVVTWPRALAYAIAVVVMGVVVGELAAMLIFAGSSDRRLDEQAARAADSAPPVVAASADLEQTRQARTALDDAVVDAGRRRDEALVVARCEFNPSPACPQTHITGQPGAGPENRTANGFLADTQQQLDKVVVERDRLAPALDAEAADDQQKLTTARDAAVATADRGFGARWLAMNAYTLDSPGATVLRALLAGLFIVLFLLPLILKLSRAKTTEDRLTLAHAQQERADLEADTAIAVKRAEVRAAIETLRAEQELTSTRLAIEAQNEIDREEQRRRVAAAIEAPTPVTSERVVEAVAELTAEPVLEESDNLPALTESAGAREKRSLIPTVPGVAGAAVRWMRPFVPPIVASAIDTTTRPLRAARQVFEETEEIHVSIRRSHRVSVTSEETADSDGQWRQLPSADA